MATSTNGTYSTIPSATSLTYALSTSSVANYLKFQVTPVSTVATGTAVQSNASGQIQNFGVPTATTRSPTRTTSLKEAPLSIGLKRRLRTALMRTSWELRRRLTPCFPPTSASTLSSA
jgi:hypothetical protein